MPEHHRQPSGTEPLTARSPLRLRAVLSVLALIGGTALAVVFGISGDGAARWVMVVLGAGIALIAAIDLGVIARRVSRYP
ncbi:MAG TPA: DUF6343 family protein [Streptosporangiaceae bacterium]|nr:DUF6343 family protein [Streptosporangiaceae bacterium]